MALAPTETERLLSELYDAAGGDTSWKTVGLSAAAVFDAGLDLVVRDKKTMEVDLGARRDLALVMSMPDDVVGLYARDYVFRDELARRAYRFPAESTWLQQQLVDEDAWTRSPTYNEWHKPNGVCWTAGSLSHLTDGRILAIAFHRADRAFDLEERNRIDALRPHMARAVRLRLRLEGVRRSTDVAWCILDRLADPVFALDSEGRVIYANLAAEALRERGVVGHRAPGEGPVATRRPLRQSHEGIALLWAFYPVPPRLGRTGAVALAFVTPGQDTLPPNDVELAAAFELTGAESRVVRGLLAGRSLQQIAGAANVEVSTVRSQLKAVFQKTRTSRQAELVARVAATLPRLRHR